MKRRSVNISDEHDGWKQGCKDMCDRQTGKQTGIDGQKHKYGNTKTNTQSRDRGRERERQRERQRACIVQNCFEEGDFLNNGSLPSRGWKARCSSINGN